MKNKISLLLLLSTLSLIRPLLADTVVVAEATGTVEVYLASGTQISSTYVSPMTGLAVGNSIAVRWGAFLGGFTPTISNPSAWFSSANFVGVNGFLNVGGTSAGRLSASIIAGDARSHDREPATAEVAELEHRARRLYWLNPEPRSEWDTLDSRASDYGRHCTNTFEVSTIRELIAAVTEIV